MSDWLHHLPIVWLASVVFAATFLVTAGIYWAVRTLAVGERARAFKAVSPGMLPPLGLVFGLLVAFLASQVWSDSDRARLAVNREASALRGVLLLAASFPGETEAQMQALVRRYIQDVVTHEWPAMAEHHATLTVVPAPLSQALHLTLTLAPQQEGQRIAQREIVTALGNAGDARRQRIIISQSRINWVKWTAVLLEAALTLVAIGFVHSDNRAASAIALAVFASAVAVAVVLIVSHDRPFAGPFSAGAEVLQQVVPGVQEPGALVPRGRP
jgi:hypothetical protein